MVFFFTSVDQPMKQICVLQTKLEILNHSSEFNMHREHWERNMEHKDQSRLCRWILAMGFLALTCGNFHSQYNYQVFASIIMTKSQASLGWEGPLMVPQTSSQNRVSL